MVESYPVMRLLGTTADSFKVLIAREFIKELNNEQVVVITDWSEHNIIRADRKVNSVYIDLLRNASPSTQILLPKPRSDVENNEKRVGGQSTDGIGKVRLGKVRLNTHTSAEADATHPFDAFWSLYPKKVERKKSEEKWGRLPAVARAEIVADIPKRKLGRQWREGFVPNPTTYLNGERWRDQIETVKSNSIRIR